MRYVGVENSPKKAEITRRKPARVISVPSDDFAWDCERHVAFLRWLRDLPHYPNPEELLRTDYCQYLLHTRTEEAALKRALRFLRINEAWSRPKTIGPWGIGTSDGLRLDGSHRAAVAVVSGVRHVSIVEVPYTDMDLKWRTAMAVVRAEKLANLTGVTL